MCKLCVVYQKNICSKVNRDRDLTYYTVKNGSLIMVCILAVACRNVEQRLSKEWGR